MKPLRESFSGAGEITLPPVNYVRHNPLANRARPTPWLVDTTPIEGELRELVPLTFQLVRRTAEEPLFNSLLEHSIIILATNSRSARA